MLIQLFTLSMLLQFLDKWWNVDDVYVIVTDYSRKWPLALELPPSIVATEHERGVSRFTPCTSLARSGMLTLALLDRPNQQG